MNIVLELPLKKEKLDCGSPLGPLLAPYGVNINKVVDALNKMLEQGLIAINSKVPIEINMENRTWKIVQAQKKTTEQIKAFVKNGKINYSDLFALAKKSIEQNNLQELSKKIKELEGTCKSMHLEIIK